MRRRARAGFVSRQGSWSRCRGCWGKHVCLFGNLEGGHPSFDMRKLPEPSGEPTGPSQRQQPHRATAAHHSAHPLSRPRSLSGHRSVDRSIARGCSRAPWPPAVSSRSSIVFSSSASWRPPSLPAASCSQSRPRPRRVLMRHRGRPTVKALQHRRQGAGQCSMPADARLHCHASSTDPPHRPGPCSPTHGHL